MITPTRHRPMLTFAKTQKPWDIGGKQDFCENMPSVTAKCLYQLYFIRIHILESLMEVKDRAEDSDGHAGQNNGFIVCSKPDDQQWSQRRILGDCSVLQGKALKFPIIFGCTTVRLQIIMKRRKQMQN